MWPYRVSKPGLHHPGPGCLLAKYTKILPYGLGCSLMCLHIHVAVVAAQNVNYLFCNLFIYLFIYFRCLKEYFL